MNPIFWTLGLAFVLVLTYLFLITRGKLWLHRMISGMGLLFTMGVCLFLVSLGVSVVLSVELLMRHFQVCEMDTDAHVLASFCNTVYSQIPNITEASSWSWHHVVLIGAALLGYLTFSGCMLSLFVNWLQNYMRSIAHGERHYQNLQEHYVVIGSGVLLQRLLLDLFEKGKREGRSCIVVLSPESIPELRKRLSAALQEKDMKKLVLLHGDRTNEEDLRQLNLPECREIYLMGDFRERDKDDLNLSCLSLIDTILKSNNRKGKRCNIFLERYDTFTLFQGIANSKGLDHLEVEPCCFFKNWAEKVLCIHPETSSPYLPLDRGEITLENDKYVHLVVIGMSRMGLSLVTEAAQQLYFANTARHRTRITMIDKNARREMHSYTNLHSSLFNLVHYTYREYPDSALETLAPIVSESMHEDSWLKTEFHFVQGNAESPGIRHLLNELAAEPNALLTVAICLPDNRHALSLALSLPQQVYASGASILVQQSEKNGLFDMLSGQTPEKRSHRFAHVRPFGMLNDETSLAAQDDSMAMLANFLYKEREKEYTTQELYSLLQSSKEREEMQKEWHELSLDHKISNRYLANHVWSRLRCLGYTTFPQEDEPSAWEKIVADIEQYEDILAEMEQYRWCMERLITGYRPLTPQERLELKAAPNRETKREEFKDAFAHPAIVPWPLLLWPGTKGDYDTCICFSRHLALFPMYKQLLNKLASREKAF